MSIRLRLVSLVSCVVLLTLGIATIFFSFTVSQMTRNVLEQTLRDEAQRIAAKGTFADLASFHDTEGAFEPLATRVRTCLFPTTHASRDGLPLSTDGLHAAQAGELWTETAFVDGQAMLIHNRPLMKQGHLSGIVQVARPLAQQAQTVNQLHQTLLLAGGIATLAGASCCWLLAGWALRPLTRLGCDVESIGATEDFGQRLALDRTPREVKQLAFAFNAMLGKLDTAYQEVGRALESQQRFVADASHELRAPLTTMRGNLALLKRDPPIPVHDQNEVLADMVAESERMMRLVRDLLLLAQSDAGRAVRSVPLLVAPFVTEMARKGRLLGPDRVITSQSPLDAVTMCDPDALQQVMLILLDNAIKCTPAGGQIALSVEVQSDWVAIAVRDTGRGIDAALLPHIFERFYRGTAARRYEGAGLGLPIARALVEAQHGTLTVRSQLGQGSIFTVTLPRGTDTRSHR